jgi:uncharacterized metal-binding protein YceD (DUF177 family)
MHRIFADCLPVDQIRHGERIAMVAGESERKAIAERLGLLSLDRLEAHVALERDGARVRADGRIRGTLKQACVATGEPVTEAVDEPFEIIFLSEPEAAMPDEEIELSQKECDVVFYDGAAIDLGSALADTLALAVDPFPRSAGADAALREAKVLSESEASPFAALAKLRKDSGAS